MADTLLDASIAAAIRERMNKLTPESSPRWGKMNVNQMMCHVTDGFLMSMGDRPLPDESNFFSRTFIKFLVIKVIKMPKEVPTMPGLDQMKEGTKPGEFEDNRRAMIDALDKLYTLPPDHVWAAHPKFGPLTAREWGILGYKHVDHHLRQFGV